MSYEEGKQDLPYLMFLKNKRDSTIKARGCADGWSEFEYTTKTENSSPTVSLEVMMLSCASDTKERHYMVVTDISDAFLHDNKETAVHMLLEGTIAELIIKLKPSLYK